MSAEVWLPIPGFEGWYSISSLGRVRSEQRSFRKRNGQRHSVRQRVMKPYVYPWGKSVKLARYGKYTQVCPHVLVRELFGGEH